MLPKIILVPTDLSDRAEQALDYACELAKNLGATIHLVNVVGIPSLGIPELGLAVASTTIDQIMLDNQTALDKLADARRASVNIGQVMLKCGDAKDLILETAQEIGADLIVMSTHGRHGLSRALLGSVAETVVRSSPCPVLTVRISADEQAARDAA
ncbi:MAG: universal stress protein [Myxococcales bacterium]|nr:universal stress protein [Myxococcales bacterium]